MPLEPLAPRPFPSLRARENAASRAPEIKSDPDLRRIPVTVLSTSEAEQDIAGSYDESANSYITKPVDIGEFKQAIIAVTEYWFTVVKLPPKRQ